MVNLALTLRNRHEIEFFVYYPDHDHFGDVVADADIPVHVADKSVVGTWGVLRALRGIIARGSYDGILSFLGTPNLLSELAAVGRRDRPAVVVSERANWSDGVPVRARVCQPFHRLADRVVVNSHHQREWMEGRYPWLASRLVTIGNGVDLAKFPFTPLPDGPRVKLLAIGRAEAAKNPGVVVEALVHYRRRFGTPPKVRWVGRTDDSRESAEYRKRLQDSLSSHGLEDSFEWLGERADVPQLLREHHALIHPSLSEGMPNVVCEAFSAGRPVLLSDVCDHPRLVEGEERGFLFHPHDGVQLAGLMHRFAELPSHRRAEMGRAARQYAERELSIEGAAARFDGLFAELLGGSGSHARRHDSY